MVHHILQVLWVYCVEDVEEVLPVGYLRICITILEVDVEGVVILQICPHPLHREFIPLVHGDVKPLKPDGPNFLYYIKNIYKIYFYVL